MEENKKKSAPKKQAVKKETTQETKTLDELGTPEIAPAIGQEDIDSVEEDAPQQDEASIPSDTILTPELPVEEIVEPTIEGPVTLEEIQLTEEEMKAISQIEVGLSKIAEKWAQWLQYYRFSPEAFLQKYPTHKYKGVIEEIIAFNAKK